MSSYRRIYIVLLKIKLAKTKYVRASFTSKMSQCQLVGLTTGFVVSAYVNNLVFFFGTHPLLPAGAAQSAFTSDADLFHYTLIIKLCKR